MKRTRNGAEIKSLRPDDVLFPLFPMQNSIPKSITLRRLERRGEWRRRRGAHMATDLRILLKELLKTSMALCVYATYLEKKIQKKKLN